MSFLLVLGERERQRQREEAERRRREEERRQEQEEENRRRERERQRQEERKVMGKYFFCFSRLSISMRILLLTFSSSFNSDNFVNTCI